MVNIDNWISQLSGWELVTGDWPSEQPAKGDDEKFFFNSDTDNHNQDSEEDNFATLKFKPEWIKKNILNKSATTITNDFVVVEISFKFWIANKGKSEAPQLNLYGASSTTINLFERFVIIYLYLKNLFFLFYAFIY